MRRSLPSLVLAVGIPLLAALSRTASGSLPVTSLEAPLPSGPDVPAAGSPPVKKVRPRGGSVALDRDRRIAFVADADRPALHAVTLLSGAVETVPLPCAPEQALVDGDDVFVTLRSCNRVARLHEDDRGTLAIVALAEVPTEPFGLALTDDDRLLVTSAFAARVTALDALTLHREWQVEVPREPRGIVVTADGHRAFVSHVAGGVVTVLDLASSRMVGNVALSGDLRNTVDSSIGAATPHPASALAYALVATEGRVLVPHVLEQNGREVGIVSSGGYGGVRDEDSTSVSSVSVLDARTGLALFQPRKKQQKNAPMVNLSSNFLTGSTFAPEGSPARQARAAALAGDTLLVTSLGTDELVLLDARSLEPSLAERGRIAVGSLPTGVDADADTDLAVVWSQGAHTLSVIDLFSQVVRTVEVADDPLSAEVAAGRRLFFTDRDRRISRDGRACASCHPDGRDDGVTWQLGSGPRQTPMLVGRMDHGPFGWDAAHATMEDHMKSTMTRLGGAGLPAKELAALSAFIRQGLSVPSPATEPADDVTRGRELFSSEDVGCAGCHALDKEGSDHHLHDVGSKTQGDVASFRTPPLRFLSASAPYFHDGRYPTLEALLDDNLDRMGRTSTLPDEDRRALLTFLRTL
jgi:mono/diheme cytochrome c family protein